MSERREDPVLRHARREAWVFFAAWAAATAYCCVASYLTGYARPGPDDVRTVLGMPSWFLWSVMVPWAACGVFTLIYVGFFMVDDDLGRDHATELDRDIREAAGHAE
jgi:hypothetical protein